MLRMVLLGLLIPLGVGVLAAMELKTPARSVAVPVQPIAGIAAGTSEPGTALSRGDRLEKADRLEIAAASSETPAQPVVVGERIAPSEISVGSSEPPRVINRHRHDPKPKKVVAAAAPKSKPKKADAKPTAISERRKAAGNTGSCRLTAFGGLLKALGSADCEI